MNAFKKFAALLLALMMILSLAACGSKSDDSAQGSSDGDASPDDTAKSKIEQIKEAGVLVRFWDKPVLRDFCRITVGSPAENDILLRQLHQILS